MIRNKSSKVFVLILLFIFSLSTLSFATEEIPPETDVPITDGDAEGFEDSDSPSFSSVVSQGNDCLCGREYYTETTDEHSKYDCIKCGKNMYACTCNCWCGAYSVLDTSGIYGSISPRLCSGCNLPCPDCTCRTDKEEVLAAEKLRINGEVSPLNIPRPENGAGLFIALLFVALFSGAALYLPYAPFLKKKHSVPEEKVDLAEVFTMAEEPKDETDGGSASKKKAARTQNGNSGFSVYEKVNVPGMIAAKNIISVNTAAAKIILNDSKVFCGDGISVSEVTEKLVSEEKPVARTARFPEFFGEIPETEEAGEVSEE